MGTESKSEPGKSAPPTEKQIVGEAEEQEDDRLAAEEASEVEDEDEAAVTDAREERIP